MNQIYPLVQQILEDGHGSEKERSSLKKVLERLLGGTCTQNSTQLFSKNLEFIYFDGSTFCFTGVFDYGKRKYVEQTAQKLGGLIKQHIIKDLDYLVVGSLLTKDWANTKYGRKYGRKIEKAVDFNEKGFQIKIISEENYCSILSCAV